MLVKSSYIYIYICMYILIADEAFNSLSLYIYIYIYISRTRVQIPFRTISRVFTLCLFILSLTGLSLFVLFIFVKKAYKPSSQLL